MGSLKKLLPLCFALTLVLTVFLIPGTTRAYTCEECGEWKNYDDVPRCEECKKCVECVGDLCEECGLCNNCIEAAEDAHCVDCKEFCLLFADEGFCKDCYRCEDCTELMADNKLCWECFETNLDSEVLCPKCNEVIIFDMEGEPLEAMGFCGSHCDECYNLYMCPSCTNCTACEETELCETCGLCSDCAESSGAHCSICDACSEDLIWCISDGDHCYDCCQNNDQICDNCNECSLGTEYDFCESCHMCDRCWDDTHCIYCGECMEDLGYCEDDGEDHCPGCCDYCDICKKCALAKDQETVLYKNKNYCLDCLSKTDVKPSDMCERDGNHTSDYCLICDNCGVCFGDNPKMFCVTCQYCYSCSVDMETICVMCDTCLLTTPQCPTCIDEPLCVNCCRNAITRSVGCEHDICTSDIDAWTKHVLEEHVNYSISGSTLTIKKSKSGYVDFVTITAPWLPYIKDIDTVIFEDGVDRVPANAFHDYYASSSDYNFSIMTVVIPGSVKSIGENAFRECRGIMTLTLGEGIEVIETSAFDGCYRLKDFLIPDSVTRIESFAFTTPIKSYNRSFTFVGDAPESIDESSFRGNGDILCYYPEGNTTYASLMEQSFMKVTITWVPSHKLATLPDGWNLVDGKWQYIENGKARIGWIRLINTWYYTDSKGNMVTGWQLIKDKWYYFSDKGKMLTGWQHIGNKWYYFTSNGDMLTGWQHIGNKWYYFTSNGDMLTGWQKIGNKWYYFTSNGDMLTEWQHIGNKWYYFTSNGDMLTGWQKIGNNYFYFTSNGYMVTGWQKIGNYYYYFNNDGILQTAKWIQSIYYVDANGARVTYAYIKNGNNYYWVNKDGVYTKTYSEKDTVGYTIYDQATGKKIK